MNHYVATRAATARDMGKSISAAAAAVFRLPETLLSLMYVWQTRIDERRHLIELDDHMLADMGLDRDAVKAETSKPFWRA